MSPLPLGILASAGAAPANAFELIQTTVLSTDTTTINFTSIPQGFRHLQVRAVLRVWDNNVLEIRFNNDSSLSYASHWMRGNGSNVASTGGHSSSAIAIGQLTSRLDPAGAFSPVIIDVLDYASTTKAKTLRALAGEASSAPDVRINSAAYFSTSPITSASFRIGSGQVLLANSRISLYGIRG